MDSIRPPGVAKGLTEGSVDAAMRGADDRGDSMRSERNEAASAVEIYPILCGAGGELQRQQHR
jgi:hypothetical protein